MAVSATSDEAPTPEASLAVTAETMCQEEVFSCGFSRWYQQFRDISIRSKVIPLPEEFVQYLLSDGMHACTSANARQRASSDCDSEESEWGDGGSDSNSEVAEEPTFPELEHKVNEAIKSLGGLVLPKLDWSAPKDARWLLGTLKCDSAAEVFMVLKASDFIAHDLAHSLDHCQDAITAGRRRPDSFSLVLRKWTEVNEASEFRCFVHGRKIIAISQRHTSLFFKDLLDQEHLDAIFERISHDYKAFVQDSFELARYAVDVVVGKAPRRKVTILDFSPWGASTDPLLFDWDELGNLAQTSSADAMPEVRVVRAENECRAKLEQYHALPVEIAELGANTPEEFEAMMKRAGIEEPTAGNSR